MSSPRISRYARDAELEMERNKPRVGLSQYTSSRLAELRARRAAQEDDLRSTTGLGATSNTSSTEPSRTTLTNTTAATAQQLTTDPDPHSSPHKLSSRENPAHPLSSTTGSPRKITTDNLTSPTKSFTSGESAKLATREYQRADKGTIQYSDRVDRSDSDRDPYQASHKTVLREAEPNSVNTDSSRLREESFMKSSSVSIPTVHSEGAAASTQATDIMSRSKEYKADYSQPMHMLIARSNPKSMTEMDEDDSVGFSSLPEQVHRKALKRGFDFTLMVVGESGLGKSTLIQSLFLNTELYNDRKIGEVQERRTKTVEIEKKYMEIEERGVKLRLTIVDTPGFNDSLCGEDSWKPVETYIDQQFEQYFKDESGLNRKNIKDNRVHCCLYFVSPFGHGLRPLDIYFMKRLHHKVNIVPIIAKADTLTHAEVMKMKASIMDQIENNDIHIYQFPDCDSDEDEEFKKQDMELKASIPFAVIGSNTIVEVGGKKIRGRLYPWGIVEVDNPDHCDFTKLRQMLISTHMQDLKDVTRDSHYENYRAKHISEEMSRQAQRDRNKLKRDSSPNFESIIATEELLDQKDEEIRQMQEMLMKMKTQLKASQSPVSRPKMSGLGNL